MYVPRQAAESNVRRNSPGIVDSTLYHKGSGTGSAQSNFISSEAR